MSMQAEVVECGERMAGQGRPAPCGGPAARGNSCFKQGDWFVHHHFGTVTVQVTYQAVASLATGQIDELYEYRMGTY